MQFIYGLLGIISAFIIIKYRHDIYKILGKIDWAESYLGGTVNLIFFTAIFIMILSFLFMIGEEGVLFGGMAKYFGG